MAIIVFPSFSASAYSNFTWMQHHNLTFSQSQNILPWNETPSLSPTLSKMACMVGRASPVTWEDSQSSPDLVVVRQLFHKCPPEVKSWTDGRFQRLYRCFFSSLCVSPVAVAGRESDVALKDIPPFFFCGGQAVSQFDIFHFVNFGLKDCIKDLNTAVRKD